jgi:hypothetical protein
MKLIRQLKMQETNYERLTNERKKQRKGQNWIHGFWELLMRGGRNMDLSRFKLIQRSRIPWSSRQSVVEGGAKGNTSGPAPLSPDLVFAKDGRPFAALCSAAIAGALARAFLPRHRGALGVFRVVDRVVDLIILLYMASLYLLR